MTTLPCPPLDDTGWDFFYRQTSSTVGAFAYKIDRIVREKDTSYNIWNDPGKANLARRQAVHDRWEQWWQANESRIDGVAYYRKRLRTFIQSPSLGDLFRAH